jgi:hypothetical protein
MYAFGKLYGVYIDISRVYHMHLIASKCIYVYLWYGRVSVVLEMPRKKIRGIKEVYLRIELIRQRHNTRQSVSRFQQLIFLMTTILRVL